MAKKEQAKSVDVSKDESQRVAAEPPDAAAVKAESLVAVETLGADIPAWQLAGLMRSNRWAEGKMLTRAEFDAALDNFRKRPLGGGR
ncbi:hypothetical protein [Maridesulfovibrio bastinii]|uniref:hypothetical protein n=1 Tax=Maridesulfovibrio bastinii TaxID=47157 RepID=UPI000429399B|nr:hypothetical protein [Maridesulfovibrio bastinii]